MLELLSPAGSPEAVIASVQSGADAVYLGYQDFNARRGAVNFSVEELENAARYCRVRDCKVYVTFNALVSDPEMGEVQRLALLAARAGADAFLVADLGLARVLRGFLPGVPLFAGVNMDIHDLPGVRAAAEMGFKRVILPPELSLEQIRAIAVESPVELGVFTRGSSCVSHSGQCYLSTSTVGRSANRGSCARPCLEGWTTGGRMDDFPLSMREGCAVRHLRALEDMGVCCVMLGGREKRPEYAAAVTAMYSRAIKDNKQPGVQELERLEAAFGAGAGTDGYLAGEKGPQMFAPPPGTPDRDAAKIWADIRKGYSEGERRRAPVRFYALIRKGESSKFIAEDASGNRAAVSGPLPVPAVEMATTARVLSEILYKTGGTPYICSKVTCAVDPEVYLPEDAVADARHKLLSKLSELRRAGREPKRGQAPSVYAARAREGPPLRIFQVSAPEQLTPELASCEPNYLYAPLELLCAEFGRLEPFLRKGAVPVAVLPRVIYDGEFSEIRGLLLKAAGLGVKEALVSSVGHITLARVAGFDLRGDFGLNAYNAQTLQFLSEAHFLSATASFELKLSQIRDLLKPLDLEMLAYGRLPLMITDNCLIKNSTGRCACQTPSQLSDRKGGVYPVVRDFGCRNVVYGARKLFLADRQRDYSAIGLWGVRLLFTTESSRECFEVAKSYLRLSDHRPNGLTRGRYYKGVEH